MLIFCKLNSAFCRKISLFAKNIWLPHKKSVILHRFSMTPALKVRGNTRDAYALARTKNGIGLKKKGDNYEKVHVSS